MTLSIQQHHCDSQDDMDYIGLLGTLIDQGLTLWQWKFNSYDHNCVEASFIVKKDGAA